MDNSPVHKTPAKLIPAARFKAECLRLIERMREDREPVTITRRGQPVALLTPIEEPGSRSIIGALKGAVLRYEDPFAPAANPEDWDAAR